MKTLACIVSLFSLLIFAGCGGDKNQSPFMPYLSNFCEVTYKLNAGFSSNIKLNEDFFETSVDTTFSLIGSDCPFPAPTFSENFTIFIGQIVSPKNAQTTSLKAEPLFGISMVGFTMAGTSYPNDPSLLYFDVGLEGEEKEDCKSSLKTLGGVLAADPGGNGFGLDSVVVFRTEHSFDINQCFKQANF